jgi:hypothetical protein
MASALDVLLMLTNGEVLNLDRIRCRKWALTARVHFFTGPIVDSDIDMQKKMASCNNKHICGW